MFYRSDIYVNNIYSFSTMRHLQYFNIFNPQPANSSSSKYTIALTASGPASWVFGVRPWPCDKCFAKIYNSALCTLIQDVQSIATRLLKELWVQYTVWVISVGSCCYNCICCMFVTSFFARVQLPHHIAKFIELYFSISIFIKLPYNCINFFWLYLWIEAKYLFNLVRR